MYKTISIIGIGGAGAITIKRMKDNLSIHSIIVDTKTEDYIADETILIGQDALQMESNEEIQLSDADLSKIRTAISNYQIILICGGFGGKTGTSIIPSVARIANEENKIVIAVAYKPFAFEGNLRSKVAEKGIEQIKEIADFTIIVSNEMIAKILPRKQTFSQAFATVDTMIFEIIEAIDTETENNSDLVSMKINIINKLKEITSDSKLIEGC